MQPIGLDTPTGGVAGSTVDAMSDAIEGADVMLYGESLAYKESANVSAFGTLSLLVVYLSVVYYGSDALAVACILQCRMEANYAHQQELDMIPLMMQKDYSPKGYVRNCRLCTLRELVQGVLESATDSDQDRQKLG